MVGTLLPSETDIVVIGAGIIGASLVHHLAEHGAKRVALLDKGAAFATGGSTTHAPGGLTQVFHLGNPLLTEWCRQSADLYGKLGCFHNIGSLELAWTDDRMEMLRAVDASAKTGGGFEVNLVSADRVGELFPMLRTTGMKGALHTKVAGRVDALLAVERMIAAAASKMDDGFVARFLTPVSRILVDGDHVIGVETDCGHIIRCSRVAVCCGAWGNELLRPLDKRLAMANVEHSWALTTPLSSLPSPSKCLPGRSLQPGDGRHQSLSTVLPAIYDGDGKVYYQTYGQQLGIGSYGHAGKIFNEMSRVSHAEAPFSRADFLTAWNHSRQIFRGLEDAGLAVGFNGLMTGTPDGMPLVGELHGVSGLWVGEACWIKYAAGLGDALAKALLFREPIPDKAEVNRFDLQTWTEVAVNEAVATGYENRTAVPKAGAQGWHSMYFMPSKL